MSFVYFAYGSNMLRERLRARCPGAELQGLATLPDYRLTFDKISRDGSGKCAYEAAKGETLPGVIWEIEETDSDALDRLAGLGHGYDEAHVNIIDSQGETFEALTYFATQRDASRKPYDWYWALVLAGAMQHDLPQSHIERIRAEPRICDSDLMREQRVKALTILKRAGYGDLL